MRYPYGTVIAGAVSTVANLSLALIHVYWGTWVFVAIGVAAAALALYATIQLHRRTWCL